MKKIVVQSKISYLIFVLFSLVCVLLCFGVFYILYFCDFASSKTKTDGMELIGFIVFIFPILFKSLLSKDIYLGEISVSKNYLELIYKKQNKITSKTVISKDEIEKFSVNAGLITKSAGKGTMCVCTSTTSIKLKNGKSISFSQDSTAKLFGCPYQYVLDILSVSTDIPNFNLRLHGDNEFAKTDIDYFKRFGRRMPFSVSSKYVLKKTPLFAKIILGICFLSMAFSFGMLIFMNLPSMPLTADEKEYMIHYNNAHDLSIKKDYNAAIVELEKAKKYVSNNTELYRELGYNYQKLKEYNNTVNAAKEGLKYVNNTNTAYRKYHNFKFIPKDDISLYSIIAQSERDLKNYPEAIEAYSYIIEKSRYTYDDSVFWRGYCYYYLGNINLAHKDFLRYKEIILKYFNDQQETEYKDMYPRFSDDDLNTAQAWISATR